MKINFENILKRKWHKVLIRIVFATTILIIFILLFRTFSILPKFKAQNEVLRQYYSLNRELENLPQHQTDTLQTADSTLIYKGVLIGWVDAAKLIEKIREHAKSLEIEFTYDIDSLITTPFAQYNIYRIPIIITAFPSNGKFETLLQFCQNTVTDSSLYLSLENILIKGDDFGLSTTSFTVCGWIKL